MVKTKLVDQLIENGAEILCQLDRNNFPVEAMFWIDQDHDYWRLIIGSKTVADAGGIAAFVQLDGILSEMDLAAITLNDIWLLDPDSLQFKTLRTAAASSGRLAVGSAWVQFDNAVVYRWNDEFLAGDLTCSAAAEELRTIWDFERKTSGDSDLLIDLQNSRLTVRFHPKYVMQTGIKNDKYQQKFQSALHRARPNCNINWVA